TCGSLLSRSGQKNSRGSKLGSVHSFRARARMLMPNFKTCSLALLPGIFLAFFCSNPVAAQVTTWADLLGGKGNEVGTAVATDLDGNVFIAGTFESVANLGGKQLSS